MIKYMSEKQIREARIIELKQRLEEKKSRIKLPELPEISTPKPVPMLALENLEIKTERQRNEREEIALKKSLQNYCYNYDLNIIDVKVIDWIEQYIYFRPRNINLKFEIPKTMRITMTYSRDQSRVIINDYIFDKFITKGGFGSVFKFIPKFKKIGISGFALKVMLSNNIYDSIKKNIIPELKIINQTQETQCLFIKSKNLKIQHQKYLEMDYDDYNIYRHNDHNLCMALTCMPLADGDTSDLNKERVLNLEQKKELFGYIVTSLRCVLENHNLVYPDIKLEQVLYFNCRLPDGTNQYIFVLGDLGGFQEFEDSPVITYGPKWKYIKKYGLKPINLSMYALAATWHQLYSPAYLQIEYRTNSEYNIMYESNFNVEYIEHIKQRIGFVPGLVEQRKIITKLLYLDPRRFKYKKDLMHYLNKLYELFTPLKI